MTLRISSLFLLLVAVSVSAAGVDTGPVSSPLCPTTPDALTSLPGPVAIAGNGSGFLLAGANFVQPLDANGRPAAEARNLQATVEFTDLDWAGDRYIATVFGAFLSAYTADGTRLAVPSQLPFYFSKAGWNCSRGLVLGLTPGEETNALWAAPAANDGTFGKPLYLGISRPWNYAVEWFGDGFLAVYVLDDLNLVAALRFDASGAPIGDVQILGPALVAEELTVAVHPHGALIAFRSYLDLLTIVPMRLDGSLGAAIFTRDRIRSNGYLLAPTPTGGLLYVHRDVAGPDADLLITLDADARAVRESRSGSLVNGILVPRDSRGLLLLRNGTTTPLDFDGILVGPSQPAMLAPANQEDVRVASDGARFVSAWITRTAVGDRIEAASAPAGGGDRACYSVHQSAGAVDGLALAGSPAGLLAVWAEAGAIRAALLAGESWIPIETGLTVALPASGGFMADLTWADDAFHVAWVDRCDFGRVPYECSLRSARISPGGVVSETGSIATAYLRNPQVAGDSLVVAATEITQTAAASPFYQRVVVIGTSPAGAPLVHEILPPVLVSGGLEPSVDIAANRGATLVLLSDRRTVETIVIGPDGSRGERTAIARGNPVLNVALAAGPRGFIASWISQILSPGESRWRFAIFTAPVTIDGALAGPIRSTELPPLDSFGWDRLDLDIATTGAESVVTFISADTSDPARLSSRRAHGVFVSEMTVHPGAPAPVSSASITSLGDNRWEVRWTPVTGADSYLVESLQRPNPWPFFDRPYWSYPQVIPAGENVASWVSSEAPVRARIYAIRNGLLSEPTIVEFARHRLLQR